MSLWGFPGGTSGKGPACQCKRCKRLWFDPWIGKISWRRKWQCIPVFLPRKSHRQRSLGVAVHRVTKSQTRLEQLSTCTQVCVEPHRRETGRDTSKVVVLFFLRGRAFEYNVKILTNFIIYVSYKTLQ